MKKSYELKIVSVKIEYKLDQILAKFINNNFYIFDSPNF